MKVLRAAKFTIGLLALLNVPAQAWDTSEDITDKAGGIETITRDYYESNIKTLNLGNYAIKVQTYERPYYETLPIIGKEHFKRSETDFITEVENNPPSARYDSRPITKVDIRYNNSFYSNNSALDSALQTLVHELNQSSYGLDVSYSKIDTQEEYKVPYEYIKTIGNNNMGYTGDKDYVSGSSDNTTINILKMKEDGFDAAEIDTGFFVRIQIHPDGTHSYIYPNSSAGYDGCIVTITGTQSGEILKKEFGGSAGVGEFTLNNDNTMTYSMTDKTYPLQNITVYVRSIITGPTDEGAWGYAAKLQLGKWMTGYRTSYRPTYFSTGLAGMDWRQDAIKFAVYGNSDRLRAYQGNRYQIINNPYFARELSYLTGNQIYYIGVGGASNQQDFKNVIDILDTVVLGDEDSAVYMDGTSNTYNKVNIDIKDFVLGKMPSYDSSQKWMLVDQKIHWETTYDDYEKDPPLNVFEHTKLDTDFLTTNGIQSTSNIYKADKILAERWRFKHNYTFYDMNSGQAHYSHNWMDNPIITFDKPGLYRVNYKRKDNPSYPNMNIADAFDSYRYWSRDYDYKIEAQT